MNRAKFALLPQMTRAALGLMALWGGLWLGGCDDGKARDPDALYMKQGYVQAPKFSALTRLTNGGVRITGRAVPEGRVRLTSDQNRAMGVSADRRGVFSFDLPPSPEGRLYELAMEDDKRLMLAEGYLFVPPETIDRVVLLRAGAPSRLMSDKASLLAVADYDQAGGLMVSGRTIPGDSVQLLVDGAPAAQTTADAKGYYSVALPVSFEGHEASFALTAESGRQNQTRKVRFNRNLPPLSDARRAEFSREDDGWRVVWLLPGGGVQVSLIY